MKILLTLLFFPMFLLAEVSAGRVLFCEASIATHDERIMIASVMYNRIGNPNFGNLSSLSQVVNQYRAFSCINDPKNKNWNDWWKLNSLEKEYWERMVRMPNVLKYDNIVYYDNVNHHTDLNKWCSAGYRPKLEYVTEHFRFYSLEVDKTYVARGWKPKVHDTFGKKVKKIVAKKRRK